MTHPLTVRVTLDKRTHRPLACVVEDQGREVGQLPCTGADLELPVDDIGHWNFRMLGIHVEVEFS